MCIIPHVTNIDRYEIVTVFNWDSFPSELFNSFSLLINFDFLQLVLEQFPIIFQLGSDIRLFRESSVITLILFKEFWKTFYQWHGVPFYIKIEHCACAVLVHDAVFAHTLHRSSLFTKVEIGFKCPRLGNGVPNPMSCWVLHNLNFIFFIGILTSVS